MMRADKQEAAEIDAELDARDAAREAARTAKTGNPDRDASTSPDADAAPVVPEADEAAGADRPWWESDPRLTDRFKRA